jgi:myo-inositol-1(or 4)-monophosphatase
MPSFVETAIGIAQEAGDLLAGFFDRRVSFELKGEHDLVTEADRASEKLVVERLRAHFPDHDIVAEEGGGGRLTGSEYRWYVDPLDGTTNFAHGFPIYNVTLGLERSGELIAGVIYDPSRREMFSAERGGGSWLNGRPIHVSKTTRLKESLVSTGFPSRKRHLNVNVHFYYQLAMMTHGVRRAGAAAIDLAWAACGRIEAFWEFKLNPWDMAAGILIVEEAGGRCTDMRGGEHTLTSPHLLADNGLIHEEIVSAFGDIFAGKYLHSMPQLPG